MGQDQLPEEARKLIQEEIAKMDEKQRNNLRSTDRSRHLRR